MQTKEKLAKLENMMFQRESIELQKRELIQQTIPQEVRIILNDIEAEFAGQLEAVDKNIALVQSELKAEIVGQGESIKGSFVHAIYTKPRVTWDTGLLEGMAVLIPDINKCKKFSEPSVSFRKI